MEIPFESLLFPAICVAILGTWVCARFLKLGRGLSVGVSILKVSVPVLYFTYFHRRSWNLLDDLSYFEQARLLLIKGNNPFFIFFTPDGRQRLLAIAGGHHFLYNWWNLLAVYLFGSYYSSPVFLNVASTFVSSLLLFKVASEAGCGERYARSLAVFFLFHWEILVWSSFVNLKDVLLILLSLLTVYLLMKIRAGLKLKYILGVLLTFFTFYWIRFYLVEIILAAFLGWTAITVRGPKKILWILTALLCAVAAFPTGGFDLFREYAKNEWVFGPIKMALTPQPWSVSPEYSFLVVPSIIHWCLFIPGLVSGVVLWLRSPGFRFAAIYFAAVIVFHGLIPELLGPRQRLQAVWVFAWIQFDFLWFMITLALGRRSSSPQLLLGRQSVASFPQR